MFNIFNNENKRHYNVINNKLREIESLVDTFSDIYESGVNKQICLLMLDNLKTEVDILLQLIHEREYTEQADYYLKGEKMNVLQLEIFFFSMLSGVEELINKRD